jgi:hypothetical protein
MGLGAIECWAVEASCDSIVVEIVKSRWWHVRIGGDSNVGKSSTDYCTECNGHCGDCTLGVEHFVIADFWNGAEEEDCWAVFEGIEEELGFEENGLYNVSGESLWSIRMILDN